MPSEKRGEASGRDSTQTSRITAMHYAADIAAINGPRAILQSCNRVLSFTNGSYGIVSATVNRMRWRLRDDETRAG